MPCVCVRRFLSVLSPPTWRRIGEIQRAWSAGRRPPISCSLAQHARSARRTPVGAPPPSASEAAHVSVGSGGGFLRAEFGGGGRQANPHAGPLASMLRGEDKIRLLGFTTLPTTRDATQFRDAWAPHTQTQRHGELALMIRPYPRDLILSYLFSDEKVECFYASPLITPNFSGRPLYRSRCAAPCRRRAETEAAPRRIVSRPERAYAAPDEARSGRRGRWRS